MSRLTLVIDQSLLAIVRLDIKTIHWPWISDILIKAKFCTISKTDDELSLVVDQNLVSDITDKIEKDFISIKVQGPLAFELTGIMLSIIEPLAKANISVFTISTYDTDYVLIKADKMLKAIEVLSLHHNIINKLI
jgi:uncharacterized protein